MTENSTQDEFIEFVEDLYDRIDRRMNLLPFMKLTGDEQLVRQSREVYAIQAVINRSIQLGCYRRAFKYALLLNKIANKMEESKEIIREKVTERILFSESVESR